MIARFAHAAVLAATTAFCVSGQLQFCSAPSDELVVTQEEFDELARQRVEDWLKKSAATRPVRWPKEFLVKRPPTRE